MSWCRGCGGVVQAGALQEPGEGLHTDTKLWQRAMEYMNQPGRKQLRVDIDDKDIRIQALSNVLDKQQKENQALHAHLEQSRKRESELLDNIQQLQSKYEERLRKLQAQLDKSKIPDTPQASQHQVWGGNGADEYQAEFYREMQKRPFRADDRPAAPLNQSQFDKTKIPDTRQSTQHQYWKGNGTDEYQAGMHRPF